MSWLLECIQYYCAATFLASNLCLMVGTCWLIITFVKDIFDDLLKLNMRRASRRHGRELKTRFCYIIQLYAEVKQLSLNER